MRDARSETGPPARSRVRATYLSDVRKLNAFASLSLFLPLLSSSSTFALALIFTPPLRLLQTPSEFRRSTELDAASAAPRSLSLFRCRGVRPPARPAARPPAAPPPRRRRAAHGPRDASLIAPAPRRAGGAHARPSPPTAHLSLPSTHKPPRAGMSPLPFLPAPPLPPARSTGAAPFEVVQFIKTHVLAGASAPCALADSRRNHGTQCGRRLLWR